MTEVVTRISADRHERLIELAARRATSECSSSGSRCRRMRDARSSLSDPWDYAELRRGRRGVGLPRDARSASLGAKRPGGLWLEPEYRPGVAMLCEADLIGDGTETEAYMRIAAERYRLLRTQPGKTRCQRVVEPHGVTVGSAAAD